MTALKPPSRYLLRMSLVLLCGGLAVHAAAEEPKPERTPPKIRPGNAAAPKGAVFANEEHNRIRLAVKKGVFFLKSTQAPTGTWGAGVHSAGYAAMPGLALLEVGVPASDAAVQKAAFHVRSMAPALNQTYDLGLAILFLDKLGDRRDVPIIRSLALRLVAGQSTNGGWWYTCPVLNTQEEQLLLTFLRKNQPLPDPLKSAHPYLVPLPKNLEPLLDPLTRREKDFALNPLPQTGSLFDPLDNPLNKDPAKNLKFDVFELLDKVETPRDPKRTPDAEPKPEKPAASEPPARPDPPRSTPPKIRPAAGRPNPEPKPVETEDALSAPARLDQWPSVAEFVNKFMNKGPQPKGKGRPADVRRDDNSNTQFAILGLWAARRHGSPVTLTLTRLDQRFRSTQSATGAWGYTPGGGGTPAMTCVGLLGLGVAHGAFHDAVKAPPRNELLYDPAMQKGLAALSLSVGPQTSGANLYFLWSLERVGVMYHLPTLRNVDWHAWGTELLLPRQSPKGSWALGGYPGADATLDTSMALLFLGRANLSRDLSESLRRNVVIVDPAHLDAR